jgi:hypothetical protein
MAQGRFSVATRSYGSLQNLAGPPDETKVYCGHEYTLCEERATFLRCLAVMRVLAAVREWKNRG